MNDFDARMVNRFKVLVKVAYLLLAPLAFATLLTLIPDADQITASVLIQVFLGLLAIPAVVYRLSHSYRFEPVRSGTTLMYPALALVALPGLVLALSWVRQVFEVEPQELDPNSVLILLAVSVLIAPVTEEVFFRGIPSVISSVAGRAVAVGIYALLFVLSHVTISHMPSAIVVALLGSIAVLRGASLLAVVGIHLVVNLGVLILSSTITLLEPMDQPIWIQGIYALVMVASLGASLVLSVSLPHANIGVGLGSGGAPEPGKR